MASDFETFLETTQRAADVGALNACFYDAIRDEGYENLVFVSASGAAPLDVLCAQLPSGYVETYLHNKWAAVDPVLRQCRMARQPFSWDSVVGRPGETAEEARFFAACDSIGVHGGVTMPFHNPDGRTHVVSLSLRGRERPDVSRLPYLYALAAQTWIRHNALAGTQSPPPARVRLTSRERECLLWAKEGKTNWEISTILSLAERTVEFHVCNAMRKLGATNRVTAIVIALQEGLIAI